MELLELISKDKETFNTLVHKRHSERNYFPKKLVTDQQKQALDAYAKTLTQGPMGTKIYIGSTDQFMGTFKMIHFDQDQSQCPYFYIGAILTNIEHPQKLGLVDFGYVFEKLLLYATHLELGTCWLGGAFHSKEAEKYLGLDQKVSHKVVCISPVGKCKQYSDLGFINKIFHKIFNGSHSRYPINKIFFLNDFKVPLTLSNLPESLKYLTKITENKESAISLIFDSFRWAPSASNSQSWKVLYIEKDRMFLFFTSSMSNYYKFIDIGIAMVHWEAACIAYGMKGKWDIGNTLKLSVEVLKERKIKLPSMCVFHVAWLMG